MQPPHADTIKTQQEEHMYNPFNPVNVMITLSDVQGILTRYGLPSIINNMELYRRAFIHSSYTKRPDCETTTTQPKISLAEKPSNCHALSTKSNETLEYLGDGILEAITKFLMYRRFPKQEPGFMTDKKIAIVKNEAIGRIAMEMGLHQWLMLSRNAEQKKTRTNLKRLGCLFESFLGALFLDFNKGQLKDEHQWFQTFFLTPGPGFQMAQVFVENVFAQHIDWAALIQNDDNYKNLLQIKIQKEFKVTPHYLSMDESLGSDGYQMGVFLCVGQSIHTQSISKAITVDQIHQEHEEEEEQEEEEQEQEGEEDHDLFPKIQKYIQRHEGKIFLYLGHGVHKIKRKAEQIACRCVLQLVDS